MRFIVFVHFSFPFQQIIRTRNTCSTLKKYANFSQKNHQGHVIFSVIYVNLYPFSIAIVRVRASYFTVHVINTWYSHPADCVNFSSFVSFKRTIERTDFTPFLNESLFRATGHIEQKTLKTLKHVIPELF